MGYWLFLAAIAAVSLIFPAAVPAIAWVLGGISTACMASLLLFALNGFRGKIVGLALTAAKENPEMISQSLYVAAGYAVFWVTCAFALANPLLVLPTVLQFGNIVLFKILMD